MGTSPRNGIFDAARIRRLDLLAKIASGLNLGESPDEQVEAAFDALASEMGAEYYFNYRVEEAEPEKLRLAASRGLTDEQRAALGRIGIDEYLCGRVAQERGSILVDDIDQSIDPSCSGVQELGGKAYAGFPLIAHDRLIGTISFCSASRTAFGEEEVALMRTVADQVAAALDRERLLRATRESEERFRRIADSTPAPMWVTRLDRKREFINRAYVEFLGISYEEAVDFDWRDILHPDDHDRIVAESIAGEASLEPFVLEARYQRKDGNWHWMRSTSQPRYGANGELSGFIGVAHDVTESKAAEVALKETEKRYRLAARATNDAIWDWDLINDNVLWNEALFTALGYAREDVEPTGAWWIEHVHPDDRDRIGKSIHAAIERGESRWENEYRFCASDGSYRYVLDRGSVIRDSGGRTVRMIGAMLDQTERLRAEAALRESEERLRMVQAAGGVGSFDYDLQKNEAICSPEYYAMFGLPGGSPINRETWPAAIHPDDREKALQALVRAAAERKPFDYEYRIVRADNGETRWLAGRATVIFDAEDRPWRYVGANIDITERKRAEQALREASEQAAKEAAERSAILGQLAEGVIVTDAEGRIVFVNQAAKKLHGVEALDVEPSEYAETYHLLREDGTPYPFEGLPLARAVIKGETSVDARWRIRRPDGTEVLAIGSAQPIRSDEGAQLGSVLTVRDDTRRHAAERALRDLNETLETRVGERTAERDQAWRLSQDLLVIAEEEGALTAVNDAWMQLLGWTREELVGRSFAEFTHPDDLEGTLAVFAGIFEKPLTDPYEYRFRHKDGSYRWFAWTAAFEAGRVYANGRHTTAEREQAAALAQTQEALRQSQKLEAMGQLTGGVAHDFNNLLSPIIGGLDMLQRRGVGDERSRRQIDGALQSAERAKTLVQRLLAFARRQPLQPTAVDIGSLVSGMTDLIGSTLGPAIEMRVDIADKLPPARADANQLEMALLNLAVNARDAMPDGGNLVLRVSRESLDDGGKPDRAPGEYVRLSVADNGLGMDEETRSRAVEPFFSTKGVGQGTGLGLSMVHGLAAQLDGGVEIESAPGEGTTVILWLPVSRDAVESEKARVEPLAPSERPGTALLVDDEMLVRMGTADMLDELGYEVVEANSAEDALRLLEEGLEPDLLVTDHLMPGMNGADLARVVRADRPTLPVLLISGYAEVEGLSPDIVRLTKPFRNSELAESLSALMPG